MRAMRGGFAVLGILMALYATGCCTRYVYYPDYAGRDSPLVDERYLQFDTGRMNRLEFLQAVVENLDQPFYVWSLDARLLLANKAWAEEMGINRKKALGKSMTELFGPKAVDELLVLNRQVLQTGKRARGVERFQMPDGERAYETLKWPVLNKQERIVGVAGISLRQESPAPQP